MPRSLAELIDTQSPGWPVVQGLVAQAKNPVEVLDTPLRRGSETLLLLQISTRAPLGAVAMQTGGLVVDGGWLRMLGGGCGRMEGDLARWNGLGPRPLVQAFDGALFVGHDVLGGFFALDAGALGPGKSSAFYLAPDTLEWTDLGLSYSGLLQWAFQSDLDRFYGEHRWPSWQADVRTLPLDQGFAFEPPLFAEVETDKPRARSPLPMHELLARSLASDEDV